MQWYDYLVIFIGIFGLFLALLGSYHEKSKSGVVGWILIIVALIVRVSIWLYNSVG